MARQRSFPQPAGVDHAKVLTDRGIFLMQKHHHAEAVEAFRAALKYVNNHPAIWNNLGNALVRTGDARGAIDAFSKAVKLQDEGYVFRMGLGRAFLLDGQYGKAFQQLQIALKRDPTRLQIVSYMILALRQQGRHDEANDLEGLDDLIIPMEFTPPAEYGSLETFNEAITEELLNSPKLTTEFEGRATQNGAKVDGLFQGEMSPLMRAWERETRKALDQTMAQMTTGQRHPFPTSVKGDYWLSMWANVMHRQGHQLPHNHPASWVSGCYYVALPDRVETSGEAHEGWIEFGGTAYDFPEPADAPKRLIKPEPGMLVIFPSYTIHRTVPFDSDQLRISCAFDAKPYGWPRFAGGPKP